MPRASSERAPKHQRHARPVAHHAGPTARRVAPGAAGAMTAALHHACLDAPVAAMAAAGSEGQLTLCCLDPGGGVRRYQLPPSEAGWAALGSGVIAAEAVSLAEVRLPYIVWAQSVAFELDGLNSRAVQHASARQVACEQFGDARVARATQGAGACALALGPCGARLVLASGRGALVVPAASLAADGGCRTEPVGLAGARSSLLLLCETAAALRPAVPAHAGTPRGACIGPQPCKQAHRMRAARRASTACAGPPYCVALGSGGALIASGGRDVALAPCRGRRPLFRPRRARPHRTRARQQTTWTGQTRRTTPCWCARLGTGGSSSRPPQHAVGAAPARPRPRP